MSLDDNHTLSTVYRLVKKMFARSLITSYGRMNECCTRGSFDSLLPLLSRVSLKLGISHHQYWMSYSWWFIWITLDESHLVQCCCFFTKGFISILRQNPHAQVKNPWHQSKRWRHYVSHLWTLHYLKWRLVRLNHFVYFYRFPFLVLSY